MRKEITGSTDPPENGKGILVRCPSHNQKSGRDYHCRGASSIGKLEPGTATTELTQGRFAFDSCDPFSDPRISAYLQFLSRELSDDGLPAFLHARYAYGKFQRLGTPECRRFAWHRIDLACRLSAKTPQSIRALH